MESTSSADVEDLTATDSGLEASSGYGDGFGWYFFNIRASDYAWPAKWLAACGIALSVGMLGNGWVLYAGLREKTMRNSPFHLMLLSHSLACMLLSCFVYPVQLYISIVGLVQTEVEAKFCHYSNIFLMWWVSAGLLSNGTVALNRAMSCFPHLAISRVLRGIRATWVTMTFTWAASLLLYAVPALRYPMGWAVRVACRPLMELIMMNMYHPDMEKVDDIVRLGCGFTVLVSLALSLLSYAVIIWYLYGRGWCYPAGGQTISAQRRREKLRALGVISLVFAVFIICWMPLLWGLLFKPELLSNATYSFLPTLEAALNPLIYVITMPVFRPRLCNKKNVVVAPSLTHNTTHSTTAA